MFIAFLWQIRRAATAKPLDMGGDSIRTLDLNDIRI